MNLLAQSSNAPALACGQHDVSQTLILSWSKTYFPYAKWLLRCLFPIHLLTYFPSVAGEGIIIPIVIYMEEGVRGLSDLTNVTEDLNSDLKFSFFRLSIISQMLLRKCLPSSFPKSNTWPSPGDGWIFTPHSEILPPGCQEIIYFFRSLMPSFLPPPWLNSICEIT